MPKTLKEIMGSMPTRTSLTFASFESTGKEDEVPKRISAVFSFSKQGFGFGEVAVVTDADGQTYIDSESMNKETLAGIFQALLDDAIFDTDEDPERHRKYDLVMGRQCGRSCPGDDQSSSEP
jgi:hypothetical protein